MLKKAAASIATVGILSTGLLLGTAGTASAAYYQGGCAAMNTERGSGGFRVVAGTVATNFNCYSIYGHFQMWGPGYNFNGPTNHGPAAVATGTGSGVACARLWENHGNGHFTDRGTACGNV